MCYPPSKQLANPQGTPRSVSASGVLYKKVLWGCATFRYHMIKDLLEHCPDEEVADLAHDLWKSLTTEITLLVGQEGFDTLYARSVFLTENASPWQDHSAPQPLDRPITDPLLPSAEIPLTPAQIRVTTRQLLNVFIGVLSTLIGNQVTARILDVAWKKFMMHPVKE